MTGRNGRSTIGAGSRRRSRTHGRGRYGDFWIVVVAILWRHGIIKLDGHDGIIIVFCRFLIASFTVVAVVVAAAVVVDSPLFVFVLSFFVCHA
jgi:hypothetical protein